MRTSSMILFTALMATASAYHQSNVGDGWSVGLGAVANDSLYKFSYEDEAFNYHGGTTYAPEIIIDKGWKLGRMGFNLMFHGNTGNRLGLVSQSEDDATYGPTSLSIYNPYQIGADLLVGIDISTDTEIYAGAGVASAKYNVRRNDIDIDEVTEEVTATQYKKSGTVVGFEPMFGVRMAWSPHLALNAYTRWVKYDSLAVDDELALRPKVMTSGLDIMYYFCERNLDPCLQCGGTWLFFLESGFNTMAFNNKALNVDDVTYRYNNTAIGANLSLEMGRNWNDKYLGVQVKGIANMGHFKITDDIYINNPDIIEVTLNPGINITRNALLYVPVGFASSTVKLVNNTDDSQSGTTTANTWVAGIGTKVALSKTFFLDASVRHLGSTDWKNLTAGTASNQYSTLSFQANEASVNLGFVF